MAAKQNKTLSQFSDLVSWMEKLRDTGKEQWLQPTSPGKWSIREILTHMMNWDKNSLEMMVPAMEEGAKLNFVDIEKHNQVATALAQAYMELDILIDDCIKTRQDLLALLNEKYDTTTKFTIDNRNYTYKKFVHVFIHHDEHHKQQMEAFLEREKSA
ncbi:DinB family protein [Bacillus sp. FJAT-28004]|uniref:DinB family protein n=1 Tax=Bacillus sp. FJAT-28004 TaxID=1679165 RepID=UPI0006B43099|nr:DinB family protein [Bacillus sp. FJAT-28004]